ncbi:MAG: hypothetical protein OWU32_07960 [Firmicutes bacterium]|nr:hypothetical protein [Bacillota bacterium]
MEAMTTEAIVEKMADLGATVDEDQFRQMAQPFHSSYLLSEEFWRDLISDEHEDADFPYLAASVLWDRWLPDRVRLERIDDLISQGREALESDLRGRAFRLWAEAWRGWRDWMEAQPERVLSELNDAVQEWVDERLESWVEEFDELLESGSLRNPRWAEYRLEMMQFLYGRSDDPHDFETISYGLACADSLFALRRAVDGDAMYAALAERFAHDEMIYYSWANQYSHDYTLHPENVDDERARSLLRRGLEACPDERDLFAGRLNALGGSS